MLVRERAGDAQDPRGVGGRGVGAERVREATVRALELVGGERLGAAASRRGSCSRCPEAITIDGAGSKSRSAATACSPSQSAHSTKARVDGVAAAVPAGARRAADVDVGAAAERDRPRRQSAQPGRAVEDLAHALPVIEPVAQLEQLAAAGRPGERGEEPADGLVAAAGRVVVVVVMAVTVEVVGPAAGAAPRARDGGQAAWWASRAAPSVAGWSGEASSLA